MYNSNSYGLPGQPPIRTSYNMLFAHFKQQGYSDELAGAEANRIMRQQASMRTSVGNKMTPTGTGVYPMFKQTNIPPYYQSQPLQTPSMPIPQYNKSNLLSGVKISKAPQSFAGWSLPLATNEPVKTANNNIIPIRLKSTSIPSRILDVQGNISFTEAKTSVDKPVHMPPSTTYPIPNNIKLPSIPLIAKRKDIIAKKPPVPEKLFTIDTVGQISQPPLKIDSVNTWIQKLYIHHNVTSSSKNFRKCVGNYVEDIMSRFRAGNLKMEDLVIPTKDQIYKFKKGESLEDVVRDEHEIKVEAQPEKVKLKEVNINSNNSSDVKSVPKKRVVKKPVVNAVIQSNKISDGGITNCQLGNDELQRRELRFQRFKNSAGGVYNFKPERGKPIIGTSEELEKEYLRLTAEPNPKMVRPENVLMKSFKHVLDRFIKNRNYRYIEEQFRSIRQDIQIQHLKSEFVVKVYSTNARIALLHGDLDQFNQCQTQLIELHNIFPTNINEFECYRLLYLSLQNMKMDIIRYLREMRVKNNFKYTVYYEYANMIRAAIAEENFVRYFKLTDTRNLNFEEDLISIYNQALNEGDDENKDENIDTICKDYSRPPFYCKLLFKMFESRFRMLSLYTLCRSSMSISTSTIVDILNFENEDSCIEFLRKNKLIFNDVGFIDCKKSIPVIMESPLMHSKK